jgi:predicted nucleic acid-binding protein
MRIVVDTNVLIGAVMSAEGANRRVLRRCLAGQDQALMGNALYAEMRDVMGREALFTNAPISATERQDLLDAFCAGATWVSTYFLWRPNLPDEGDNHLIELAVAGSAEIIVSWNRSDLQSGELRFPALQMFDPVSYLQFVEPRGL